MEELLVGYLLGSLDAATQHQVERHLKQHPESRQHLDRLRQALQPLADDAQAEEPPPGLWVRTLARIAHHHCGRTPTPEETSAVRESSPFLTLPPAPRAPRSDGSSSGRDAWRWVDVAAVAAIVLLAFSLTGVWLVGAWRNQDRLACQNNLRILHHALTAYSDRHHGEFPRVDEAPPGNVAAVFVPLLHRDGVLGNNVRIACPALGSPSAAVPSLEALHQLPPEQLASLAQQLSGGYAYSLGYGQPGQLIGLRSDDQRLPILADRPLLVDGQAVAGANSPNHGGRGQNVLFVDGHVQFFTVTTAGIAGDNIYLNQQGQVAAGRSRFDSVLGAGASRPFPNE